MVSILDILSGAVPLMVDVRQTGGGPNGVGCNMKIRIAAGVTRYPMTISTKYTACSAGGEAGTVVTPACTSAGNEPPLPAGRYEADIMSLIPASDGRAPSPVEVTLTAHR
jgi:hypothetical protein